MLTIGIPELPQDLQNELFFWLSPNTFQFHKNNQLNTETKKEILDEIKFFVGLGLICIKWNKIVKNNKQIKNTLDKIQELEDNEFNKKLENINSSTLNLTLDNRRSIQKFYFAFNISSLFKSETKDESTKKDYETVILKACLGMKIDKKDFDKIEKWNKKQWVILLFAIFLFNSNYFKKVIKIIKDEDSFFESLSEPDDRNLYVQKGFFSYTFIYNYEANLNANVFNRIFEIYNFSNSEYNQKLSEFFEKFKWSPLNLAGLEKTAEFFYDDSIVETKLIEKIKSYSIPLNFDYRFLLTEYNNNKKNLTKLTNIEKFICNGKDPNRLRLLIFMVLVCEYSPTLPSRVVSLTKVCELNYNNSLLSLKIAISLINKILSKFYNFDELQDQNIKLLSSFLKLFENNTNNYKSKPKEDYLLFQQKFDEIEEKLLNYKIAKLKKKNSKTEYIIFSASNGNQVYTQVTDLLEKGLYKPDNIICSSGFTKNFSAHLKQPEQRELKIKLFCEYKLEDLIHLVGNVFNVFDKEFLEENIKPDVFNMIIEKNSDLIRTNFLILILSYPDKNTQERLCQIFENEKFWFQSWRVKSALTDFNIQMPIQQLLKNETFGFNFKLALFKIRGADEFLNIIAGENLGLFFDRRFLEKCFELIMKENNEVAISRLFVLTLLHQDENTTKNLNKILNTGNLSLDLSTFQSFGIQLPLLLDEQALSFEQKNLLFQKNEFFSKSWKKIIGDPYLIFNREFLEKCFEPRNFSMINRYTTKIAVNLCVLVLHYLDNETEERLYQVFKNENNWSSPWTWDDTVFNDIKPPLQKAFLKHTQRFEIKLALFQISAATVILKFFAGDNLAAFFDAKFLEECFEPDNFKLIDLKQSYIISRFLAVLFFHPDANTAKKLKQIFNTVKKFDVNQIERTFINFGISLPLNAEILSDEVKKEITSPAIFKILLGKDLVNKPQEEENKKTEEEVRQIEEVVLLPMPEIKKEPVIKAISISDVPMEILQDEIFPWLLPYTLQFLKNNETNNKVKDDVKSELKEEINAKESDEASEKTNKKINYEIETHAFNEIKFLVGLRLVSKKWREIIDGCNPIKQILTNEQKVHEKEDKNFNELIKQIKIPKNKIITEDTKKEIQKFYSAFKLSLFEEAEQILILNGCFGNTIDGILTEERRKNDDKIVILLLAIFLFNPEYFNKVIKINKKKPEYLNCFIVSESIVFSTKILYYSKSSEVRNVFNVIFLNYNFKNAEYNQKLYDFFNVLYWSPFYLVGLEHEAPQFDEFQIEQITEKFSFVIYNLCLFKEYTILNIGKLEKILKFIAGEKNFDKLCLLMLWKPLMTWDYHLHESMLVDLCELNYANNLLTPEVAILFLARALNLRTEFASYQIKIDLNSIINILSTFLTLFERKNETEEFKINKEFNERLNSLRGKILILQISQLEENDKSFISFCTDLVKYPDSYEVRSYLLMTLETLNFDSVKLLIEFSEKNPIFSQYLIWKLNTFFTLKCKLFGMFSLTDLNKLLGNALNFFDKEFLEQSIKQGVFESLNNITIRDNLLVLILSYPDNNTQERLCKIFEYNNFWFQFHKVESLLGSFKILPLQNNEPISFRLKLAIFKINTPAEFLKSVAGDDLGAFFDREFLEECFKHFLALTMNITSPNRLLALVLLHSDKNTGDKLCQILKHCHLSSINEAFKAFGIKLPLSKEILTPNLKSAFYTYQLQYPYHSLNELLGDLDSVFDEEFFFGKKEDKKVVTIDKNQPNTEKEVKKELKAEEIIIQQIPAPIMEKLDQPASSPKITVENKPAEKPNIETENKKKEEVEEEIKVEETKIEITSTKEIKVVEEDTASVPVQVPALGITVKNKENKKKEKEEEEEEIKVAENKDKDKTTTTTTTNTQNPNSKLDNLKSVILTEIVRIEKKSFSKHKVERCNKLNDEVKNYIDSGEGINMDENQKYLLYFFVMLFAFKEHRLPQIKFWKAKEESKSYQNLINKIDSKNEICVNFYNAINGLHKKMNKKEEYLNWVSEQKRYQLAKANPDKDDEEDQNKDAQSKADSNQSIEEKKNQDAKQSAGDTNENKVIVNYFADLITYSLQAVPKI